MLDPTSSDNDDDFQLDDLNMSDLERASLLGHQSSRMGKAKYISDGENKTVELDTKDDTSKPKSSPMFIYVLSFFSAIGGFLFGYDTGVVSGAMLLLKDNFKLSSLMQEVIVSVTIGLAFVFSLIGGWMNDKFGRKLTTIIASIVFTLGAAVLAAAVNVWMLVVGRAILGMGIGNVFSYRTLFSLDLQHDFR